MASSFGKGNNEKRKTIKIYRLLHSTSETSNFLVTYNFKFSYEVSEQTTLLRRKILKICMKIWPKQFTKTKKQYLLYTPIFSNNMVQSHNNILRTCINVTARMVSHAAMIYWFNSEIIVHQTIHAYSFMLAMIHSNDRIIGMFIEG